MRSHPLGPLDAVLPLPDGPLPKDSIAGRMQTVSEAKSWPGGVDQDHQSFERLYVVRDWELGLGKPGKEVFRKKPNENDMTPTIWARGVKLDGAALPASFGAMWAVYERLAAEDRWDVLEVCGRLLYRDAFLLDHVADSDRQLRYRPPTAAMSFLEEQSAAGAGLPLDVFQYYLELVALNEDVKYSTVKKQSGRPHNLLTAGRVNNLLTSVHFILMLLGQATIADLVGSMVRGFGVSTIKYSDARDLLLVGSA